MSEIAMPALVGNDALAFLAALGVLRLATTELCWDATLCWPNGPRNGAVLGGAPDGSSISSLAEQLASIVSVTKKLKRLIPGIDGFPPKKSGSKGGDPVKDLTFDERSGLARTALSNNPTFGDWVTATLALAVPDRADPGETKHRLTAAFVRPTGQVTFDRSLAGGLEDASEQNLADAMSGWVRVDGVTGNYFDHRAIQDEFVGQHIKGQMKNAGVPGASWLALMALPLLPVRTPVSGRATTVGFRKNARPSSFQWPVWSEPLSVSAVSALMDHPALSKIDFVDSDAPWRSDRLREKVLGALRVDAVFVAERRPGPQSPDGALGPAKAIAPLRRTKT
jgi:hypothetical protein